MYNWIHGLECAPHSKGDLEQFKFKYLVIRRLPYHCLIIQFLIMNALAEESNRYDFIVDAKMVCPTTYEENKPIKERILQYKSAGVVYQLKTQFSVHLFKREAAIVLKYQLEIFSFSLQGCKTFHNLNTA